MKKFILLSITIIVFYIILLVGKSNFYTFDIDWVNNYLNTRKYTNYHFDNGLEVMLIHDSGFDMDGGAIVINKGYYENPMDEGIAIFITIMLDKAFRNEDHETILDNYFGNYGYEIDGDYTAFKFQILNSGFKKYLEAFSSVLNIANFSKFYDDFIEDDDNFNYIIEEMEKYYLNRTDYLAIKQNHLLEYLVYNLKDGNNSESLPEGNHEIINKYNKKELKEKTMKFFNKLINPENIKVVLFSKYKFDEDVMVSLFQYCYDRNALHKKYLFAVAEGWAKSGIKTLEDLDAHEAAFNNLLQIKKTVSKKLGLKRSLSEYEEAYIDKWVMDYSYPLNVIEIALKKTTSKTNPSFDYLDKIISDWHERKLSNEEEITKFMQEQKQKQKEFKQLSFSNMAPMQKFNDTKTSQYDDLDKLYVK